MTERKPRSGGDVSERINGIVTAVNPSGGRERKAIAVTSEKESNVQKSPIRPGLGRSSQGNSATTATTTISRVGVVEAEKKCAKYWLKILELKIRVRWYV